MIEAVDSRPHGRPQSAPPSDLKSADRVRHLDGIRGIAILAVCAVHWLGPRLPAFEGGYVGVDLFFVLSGFIITTLLVRRQTPYRRFVRARVRRLYPPLLGVLVGTILLAWLWPGSALFPGRTTEQGLVAAAQASSLWMSVTGAQIGPFSMTWSLAVEWYFYLLWPLAVLRLRALAPAVAARRVLLAAGALYLGALVQPAWWFYYGPTARFGELLVGAAVAFHLSRPRSSADPIADGRRPAGAPAVDGGATRPRGGWPANGPTVAAALAFVALWTVAGTDPYHLAYRLVAAPLTTACAVTLIMAGYRVRGPRAGGRREWHPVGLLSWRPLVATGRVSYSLYLWHAVPLALLSANWWGLPVPLVGVVGIALAATGTLLSYRLLEQPFWRARGGELAGRPAPATTVAAAG
ncbi:acyltransferase [Micromonospora sp. NPDC006766]|uniref:acyltransferase family protein n=1 Tax=Micromonospora sp. NPDC006766 TaxID=3154778 RepID=UPI0033D6AFD8